MTQSGGEGHAATILQTGKLKSGEGTSVFMLVQASIRASLVGGFRPHLVLREARAQHGLQCDVEKAATVGVLTGWVTQVEQQGGIALGQLQEFCQAADGLVLGLPVVGG
jgi:hypothetical protein